MRNGWILGNLKSELMLNREVNQVSGLSALDDGAAVSESRHVGDDQGGAWMWQC